ncbi:transglutaminase domain-containing protein [Candidatus Woesearchaeota archaeon]|nr:transglutaminase domain-containing protein [Candidatus Woesearchaeota archaeon]
MLIRGNILIKPVSAASQLRYVRANLSFLPLESFQQIVYSLVTQPQAPIVKDTAIFSWESPPGKQLPFSVSSKVGVKNTHIKVTEKIPFPLAALPEELEPFLSPSETIDSGDGDIVKLANELAQGEDDLYPLEFRLGMWVKENIAYDLSTMTADITQKASWVLEHKEGVCDELTNLFIALNRALGIPAKFVSGVSYTDALASGEGFGPHGWAEVYFPGYGWLPFDVTFGQFGFIDEFHIKLKEAVDAEVPSTRYEWLGKDMEIDTDPLDIRAKVTAREGRGKDPLQYSLSPRKRSVGFGSYNILEITVENPNPYYLATEFQLSKSLEVEAEINSSFAVLMKPNGQKTLLFPVRVSPSLDPDFVYTFPFSLRSIRNATAETSFQARRDGLMVSRQEKDDILSELDEAEEKKYSASLEMACEASSYEFYDDESADIRCMLKNTGNKMIAGLKACFEQSCKTMDIPIAQQRQFNFTFLPEQPGRQSLAVKARNSEIVKSAAIDVTVLDRPSVSIRDIAAPAKIAYGENAVLNFTLIKSSSSIPIKVVVSIPLFGQEISIDKLLGDRKLIVPIPYLELDPGENTISINAAYEDSRGKKYSASESFSIELADVAWWQRIVLFFASIPRKIGALM